jgi:predicted TIM-barrel fold metal-dependent hydrolase
MGNERMMFIPSDNAEVAMEPGLWGDKFFKGELEKTGSNEFRIRPLDIPGFMHRDGRLKLMDEQKIQATIMMPTAGLGIIPAFKHRRPALCANLRAFNTWLADDWGYGSDGRIFAAPMMYLSDVFWAIEELERVVELGARFVMIDPAPVDDRSPADAIFDPFWARVQALGVTPILHIGDQGYNHIYGVRWGEYPYKTGLDYTALQFYLCFGDRPISDTIAALILHNLFGRFPGIHMLVIEFGSAWVAPLLPALDKCAKMARTCWPFGELTDTPSNIFRKHFSVSPYHEENLPALAKLIGVDNILFGSDYPHTEGMKEPRDYVKALGAFSDVDVRKIMRDNAAKILGLPLEETTDAEPIAKPEATQSEPRKKTPVTSGAV